MAKGGEVNIISSSIPVNNQTNSPKEEVKEDKINVTLAESDENSKYPETSPHLDTNSRQEQKEDDLFLGNPLDTRYISGEEYFQRGMPEDVDNHLADTHIINEQEKEIIIEHMENLKPKRGRPRLAHPIMEERK